MKINADLLFKRFFSATNLAKAENSSRQVVKETPSVVINKVETAAKPVQIQALDRLKTHKLFQLAQSRAARTTHHFGNLLRGPVRSNILVSWELMKLIAAEQKLVPSLSTWPQARNSYTEAFESFKGRIVSGEFTAKFLVGWVNEITWGQVGRALRVSAEMAAFYYIGELLGMITSFPFK